MATVTPTSANCGSEDGSAVLYTWPITTANLDGASVSCVEWADRCFAASGTWGGATLTIQGSNDGTTWMTLSNAAGSTAATFTADGLKSIIELPRYVRPILTVAGSGAAISVTLLARRQQPLRV